MPLIKGEERATAVTGDQNLWTYFGSSGEEVTAGNGPSSSGQAGKGVEAHSNIAKETMLSGIGNAASWSPASRRHLTRDRRRMPSIKCKEAALPVGNEDSPWTSYGSSGTESTAWMGIEAESSTAGMARIPSLERTTLSSVNGDSLAGIELQNISPRQFEGYQEPNETSPVYINIGSGGMLYDASTPATEISRGFQLGSQSSRWSFKGRDWTLSIETQGKIILAITTFLYALCVSILFFTITKGTKTDCQIDGTHEEYDAD